MSNRTEIIRDAYNQTMMSALGSDVQSQDYTKEFDAYLESVNHLIDTYNTNPKMCVDEFIHTYEGLLIKYIDKHNTDKEGIRRGYFILLDTYHELELGQDLINQGIALIISKVVASSKDEHLHFDLYGITADYEVDRIITIINEIGHDFHASQDLENVLLEDTVLVRKKFADAFLQYVDRQVGNYKAITALNIKDNHKRLIHQLVSEGIGFSYRQLIFTLSHFYLPESFTMHELSFDHQSLLTVMESEGFNELAFRVSDDLATESAEVGILDDLTFTADQFYSHMKRRVDKSLLAEVVRSNMLEILTDYIHENYPTGYMNGVVTAIGSFKYLYSGPSNALSQFCSESLDVDYIYQTIRNNGDEEDKTEIFIQYIECILNNDLDKAINDYPKDITVYELPYFLKINELIRLKEKDVTLISDEDWLVVDTYLARLDELKPIVMGKVLCKSLPWPSERLTTMVDLIYFGNEVPDDVNPVLRAYKDFMEIKSEFVAKIKQKREIERLNQSLEAAIQSQNDMVSNYSHSWKHVVYPNAVKRIAQSILEDVTQESLAIEDVRETYKNYGLMLMKAYQSETMMKRQGQMLALKHSGNNALLQQTLRRQIIRQGDTKEGVGIMDLLKESLEMVLFGIIMRQEDASNIDESLRDMLFEGKNLVNLRQ